MKKFISILALGFACAVSAAPKEKLGQIDTGWKLVGSNPRIDVLVFDDPAVQNVSCFFTMPLQGGLISDIGLASERSDYSITCRNIGPVTKNPQVPDNAEVFSENRSPLFKTFRINRLYDRERNVLVYVVTTRVWLDGKSKSATSAISLNAQ